MANEQSPAWPLRAMLGLSVLAPLILFALTAWSSYRSTMASAERTAMRTVTALHEHAAKVLDTHEVVLRLVDRRLDGRSWEEIAGDDGLRQDLQSIAGQLEQIGSITLADAAGTVRTGSDEAFGRSIAHREYFQAQEAADAGTYVGAAFTSQVTAERNIALSRRRTTADGAFDGIITVTVPVAYLIRFWEQFVPTIAHVIPLVRADGLVIARHPALDNPDRLNLDGPFLSRALVEPQGFYTAVSQVDGVERMNAYTRIDDFPLFISFSIETRAVLQQWSRDVALYGAYTLLAVLALLGMTTAAMRQHRSQRLAAERWQDIADQLRKEMAAREKAEAALTQAQKMEALGQLTGGVAHDFNNLLQAMSSGLYLLRKKVPDDSQHVIEASLQAIDRGARLVRQLLAFARQQPLEPQPVDLCALLCGMGDLIGNAVGPAIEVDVEVEPELGTVLIDPTQAELAILNLAINARDAMEGTGRITIKAHRMHGSQPQEVALAPGQYVVLSVSDSGAGMPQEIRERAFNPFFTTKDPTKGTGLGLSIVQSFASQSGGAADIDSEPGSGTTVRLYLPKSGKEAQAASEPVSFASPASDAGPILVVDDEDLGRSFMAAGLRELGYEVHEARNGEEALSTLGRGLTADVLITDFAMPGMTGLELAAAARARLPSLPVIVVTGHVTFEDDRDLVCAVLRKPFQLEQLAQRLRRVLAERNRPVAPQLERRSS